MRYRESRKSPKGLSFSYPIQVAQSTLTQTHEPSIHTSVSVQPLSRRTERRGDVLMICRAGVLRGLFCEFMISSFCLEGVQKRKSRRVPATFLNLKGTGKS
jgi:hypothetical protein